MKNRNVIGKSGLLIALVIAAAAILPTAGCVFRMHKGPPATEAPRMDIKETPAAKMPENNLAPDFTVKNAEGKDVTLSSRFGKPIVLNFWATWCSPCRMELRDFEKMYKSYGDKVQFMMVNIEGGGKKAENVKKFVTNEGFTFPLYFDATTAAAAVYGISAIPASFFIGAEGNIVSDHVGMMNAKQLEKEILKLLP